MNVAYKHLDSKLRIASLSITQWCGVFAGIALAVLWGWTLHPFSGTLNTVIAVYIGGIPAVLTWLSVEAEFDLMLRARAFVRWRRGGDLYLPGAGYTAQGYVIEARRTTKVQPGRDAQPALPNVEALWE
jgi:hypothetical protein